MINNASDSVKKALLDEYGHHWTFWMAWAWTLVRQPSVLEAIRQIDADDRMDNTVKMIRSLQVVPECKYDSDVYKKGCEILINWCASEQLKATGVQRDKEYNVLDVDVIPHLHWIHRKDYGLFSGLSYATGEWQDLRFDARLLLELAPPELDARKPVSDADLRSWIEPLAKSGTPISRVQDLVKQQFPNNQPPSKRRVDDFYKSFNPDVKKGRPPAT